MGIRDSVSGIYGHMVQVICTGMGYVLATISPLVSIGRLCSNGISDNTVTPC